MKKQVYIFTIGMCLLISVILLILYYTQNFSSEVTFNENLSFSSDHTDYYINWIESPIGEVKLKNEGMFTEKYILPSYSGCIKLKENTQLKLNEYEVEIYIKGTEDNSIEVPVEKQMNFSIFARYYPKQSILSFKQLEENVQSVLIYETKVIESNPLRNDYGSRIYETSQKRCERLEKESVPVKRIEVKTI